MVSLCSYGTAALSVLWYMYVNTYNTYNMYNAYNTYNTYNTYNIYNTYNMYVCTYVPCMFQYINAPSYQLMT